MPPKALPYIALAIALIFTAGWVQGHKSHKAELGYKTSLDAIYEQYGQTKKAKSKPVEFDTFKKSQAKPTRITADMVAEYLPPISYKQLTIGVKP